MKTKIFSKFSSLLLSKFLILKKSSGFKTRAIRAEKTSKHSQKDFQSLRSLLTSSVATKKNRFLLSFASHHFRSIFSTLLIILILPANLFVFTQGALAQKTSFQEIAQARQALYERSTRPVDNRLFVFTSNYQKQEPDLEWQEGNQSSLSGRALAFFSPVKKFFKSLFSKKEEPLENRQKEDNLPLPPAPDKPQPESEPDSPPLVGGIVKAESIEISSPDPNTNTTLEYVTLNGASTSQNLSVQGVFFNSGISVAELAQFQRSIEIEEKLFVRGDSIFSQDVSIERNLEVEGETNLTQDLTVGTKDLHVDTNNHRVGIGTLYPQETLDVAGNLKVAETLKVFGQTELSGVLSADGGIEVNYDEGTIFQVKPATGDTEISGTLRVDKQAWFYNDLTVYGPANFTNNINLTGHLLPSANDTYDLGSSTLRWRDLYLGPASVHLGADGNEAIIGYNTTNNYITFDPDGDATEEVVIDDSGNIGIGTTSPSEKLDIVGRARSLVGSGASAIWSTLADKEFVGHDELVIKGALKGVQDSLGKNWTDSGRLFAGSMDVIQSMAYCGGGIVIAGTGRTGSLFIRSTDYGANWTNLGVHAGQREASAMAYLGKGIVVAGVRNSATTQAAIYRSTDYGATWTSLGQLGSSTFIYSIVNVGNGIALARGNTLYRSTDYGATWTNMGVTAGAYLVYLGNGIVIGGSGAHIYRSTDYGQTFTDLGTVVVSSVRSFSYLGNGIVLAGTNGHIHRSTDYGVTWTDLGQQFSKTEINGLIYMGNGVVVAGGYQDGTNGSFLRSVDYGLNWEELEVDSAFENVQQNARAYLGNGIALFGVGYGAQNARIARTTNYISAPQGQYFWSYDENAYMYYTSGNVGIGTTGPDQRLEVLKAGTQLRLSYVDTNAVTDFATGQTGDLTITPSGNNILFSDSTTLAIGGASAQAYNVIGDTTTNMGHGLSSDDDLYIEGDLEVDGSAWFDASVTVADKLTVDGTTFHVNSDTNRVGIGTTGPDRKLDILDGSNPQLRLSYVDANAYTELQTGQTGDLTINASGNNILLADSDTLIIGGASAQSYNVIGDTTTNMGHSLASDDDLYIEGDLEVDGSAWFDASVTVSDKFTVDSNTLHVNSDTNRVGIGTTSPEELLHVNGGNIKGSGVLKIDGTGDSYFLGDLVVGATAPGATLPTGFSAGRLLEIRSDGTNRDVGISLKRANDDLIGVDIWTDTGNGDTYFDNRWGNNRGFVFRLATKAGTKNAMFIDHNNRGPKVHIGSVSSATAALEVTGAVHYSSDTAGTTLKLNPGNHLTMTIEMSDVVLSAHTAQFSSNVATQRSVLLNPTTITGTSGTKTIANADILNIAGISTAGANAVISGSTAIRIPVAAHASSNVGLVSLGNGAWDGSTAGYFTGSAQGTYLAVNAASGYTGNLMDLQTAGSSRMVVTGTGKVGIGTTSPLGLFHIGLGTTAPQALFVDSSSGNVGIGTTDPTDTLHVSGDILATSGVHIGVDTTPNLIDDATNGSSSTTLYIGNKIITTEASDARKKDVIGTTSRGLQDILEMKVVDFTWKPDFDLDSSTINTGMLAQEMYQILPSLVRVPQDEETGLWSIQYNNMVPVVVRAVQEQQGQLSVFDHGLLGIQTQTLENTEIIDNLSETLRDEFPRIDLELANLDTQFEEELMNLESQVLSLESRIEALENRSQDRVEEQGQEAVEEEEVQQEQEESESLEQTLQTLVDSLNNLENTSSELNNISASILTVMESNQANTARIEELEAGMEELQQIVRFVDDKVVIGTEDQYLFLDAFSGLEINAENFSLDQEGNLTIAGDLNLISGKINAENGILELDPGEPEEEGEEPEVVIKGNLKVEGEIKGEIDSIITDTDTIKAGEKDTVIENEEITEDSFVGITPLSFTYIYISKIEEGSFTVSAREEAEEDIKFYWWTIKQGKTEDEEGEDEE